MKVTFVRSKVVVDPEAHLLGERGRLVVRCDAGSCSGALLDAVLKTLDASLLETAKDLRAERDQATRSLNQVWKPDSDKFLKIVT